MGNVGCKLYNQATRYFRITLSKYIFRPSSNLITVLTLPSIPLFNKVLSHPNSSLTTTNSINSLQAPSDPTVIKEIPHTNLAIPSENGLEDSFHPSFFQVPQTYPPS
jgi:hypothetical protein